MTPVERAHRVFDAYWTYAKQQNGHPTITCTRGCFYCCAEAAYVDKSEAAAVVSIIPEVNRAEVVERTKEWAAKFKESGLVSQPEPKVIEYRAAKLWCPLLKDGECLGYASRPMACRGHCAVKDPALCADDKTRLEQNFIHSPEVNMRSMSKLLELTGESEYDHLGCWLSELLLGEQLISAARFSLSHR